MSLMLMPKKKHFLVRKILWPSALCVLGFFPQKRKYNNFIYISKGGGASVVSGKGIITSNIENS
jgi:hypothetical protein